MNASELQRYLHDHIPQSAAMQVRVEETGADQVVLGAPLAPNINHRDSLFGGSASSISILAAWALLYTRLLAEGLKATLVIQRNSMNYERPVLGDFTVSAHLAEGADWDRFIVMLRRRGRSRIGVVSLLACDGASAGRLEGDFVAVMQG